MAIHQCNSNVRSYQYLAPRNSASTQHNRKNNDSAQISSTNTTVFRCTSTLIAIVVINRWHNIRTYSAGTLDQLQLSTSPDIIVTTIASYWKTTCHHNTKKTQHWKTHNKQCWYYMPKQLNHQSLGISMFSSNCTELLHIPEHIRNKDISWLSMRCCQH